MIVKNNMSRALVVTLPVASDGMVSAPLVCAPGAELEVPEAVWEGAKKSLKAAIDKGEITEVNSTKKLVIK